MITMWFSLSAPPQLITNKKQQRFKEKTLTREHMSASAYKCEMKKRERLNGHHLRTNKQTQILTIQSNTRSVLSQLVYFPDLSLVIYGQGIARTQSPLRKNYALESPAFGVIAEVNPTEVQWKGLALDRLPSGSKYSPCQVSMISLRALCVAPDWTTGSLAADTISIADRRWPVETN